MEKISARTALKFLREVESQRIHARAFDEDLGTEVFLIDGLRAKLVVTHRPKGLMVIDTAYVVHTGRRVQNSKSYLLHRAV